MDAPYLLSAYAPPERHWLIYCPIAQLAERRILVPKVLGSTPSRATLKDPALQRVRGLFAFEPASRDWHQAFLLDRSKCCLIKLSLLVSSSRNEAR